jgi:hypothetical protein
MRPTASSTHRRGDQSDIDRHPPKRSLASGAGQILFHGNDYHFVPTRPQVTEWIATEGLAVIDEADSPGEGYSYWHLLMR